MKTAHTHAPGSSVSSVSVFPFRRSGQLFLYFALPALLVAQYCVLPVREVTATQLRNALPHSNVSCGPGLLFDGESCLDIEHKLAESGRVYWVDQEVGRDNGPGTKDRPWKSISRSTDPGVMQPGDAVIIRSGVYRESIRPRTGGQPSKLVTWAAYPGDSVVVSGADFINQSDTGYQNWKLQEDGTWRHDWEWEPQEIPLTFDPVYRRELFVADGRVMKAMGGQTRPDLDAGQFWVEGPPAHPIAVFVRLPEGSSPNQSIMEVGQRGQLFASQGENSAHCGRMDQGYYRLLGVHFRHGTSRRQEMVVCSGSRGSLFEDISADWNNGGGIKMSGTGHTIRASRANHNGIEGIGGTGCTECLVEYNTASYNNWKSGPGKGHGGGGKWTRSERSVFRYNSYIGNRGPGLWLDINNRENSVYHNLVDSNEAQGIFVELHSNSNRILGNVVTRTRFFSPQWNGIGIVVSTSDSNLVANNTVVANEGAALRISGDQRDDATHMVVLDNLFLGNLTAVDQVRANLREIVVLGDGPQTGLSAWERIQSHRFDGNVYSTRRGRAPGNGYRATFMLAPAHNKGGKLYTNDLRDWQAAADFDPGGSMRKPQDLDFGSLVRVLIAASADSTFRISGYCCDWEK